MLNHVNVLAIVTSASAGGEYFDAPLNTLVCI